MITKKVWEYIYNAIFSIYLPPDDIIKKIILEKDGDKREFNSVVELITYLTLNGDKNVLQRDVKFILKDDKLFEKNKEFYEYIVKTIKKTS